MAALGAAIIAFCNQHAVESLEKYRLQKIFYSRCILFDTHVQYFERLLCTSSKPQIFDANEYIWKWSIAKKTTGKEQLSALHGIDRITGKKVWAWHGLGENQLHFSGESLWWNDPENLISFQVPLPSETEQVSFESFVDYLLEISGNEPRIADIRSGGTALPN